MELKDFDPLLLCYGGSHAYGTNTPESDVDIRGIFCAEERSIRTPFYPIREVDLEDQEDGKLYELTNFMNLYVGMNPNILELLWVDNSSILKSSEAYEHIRSYKDNLLSTKCAFTFSGYAIQQLKRIKGHNKWINNPQQKAAPVRKDYLKLIHNYTEDKIFSNTFNINLYNENYMLIPYGRDIYGLCEKFGQKLFNADGSIHKVDFESLSTGDKKTIPKFIVKLCEDEYKHDKENHKNYWNWVKNRNPSRHELEEKFGFDSKHGSHIVRLLRMGEEILRDGVVNVMRPDAKELLDIRNGKWTYEELLEWATEKDDYIRNVLYKSSHLPKQVDLKLAAKILMEAQDICWNK